MSDTEIDDPTRETELSDAEKTAPTGDAGPASQDSQPSTEEKRVRDAQAALTKKSQEAAQLKSEVDTLKGQVETLIKMGRQPETPQPPQRKNILEDEERLTTLLDDPKNVAMLLEEQKREILETLVLRDRAFYEELDKRDPSVRQLKGKIEELKKDPDFDGFSEMQLAVLAKKQIGTSREEPEEIDDGFRGSPAGGRRVEAKSKTETDRETESWMRKLYGNRFDK